jgi:hypothetical protein
MGDPEPSRRRLQGGQRHRDLVDCPRPTRFRSIVQAGQPLGGVPLLSADHGRLGNPDPLHDALHRHIVAQVAIY